MTKNKLSEKEKKKLTSFLNNINKSKDLSLTEKRGEVVDNLIHNNANRGGEPSNNSPIESNMEMDKLGFMWKMVNDFKQQPAQGNQGNNKDSGLIELQKMKLMKELFSQQQQPQQQSATIYNVLGKMVESADRRADHFASMLYNEMRGGQGQTQPDPMEKFMKGVEFTERRMGNNRTQTKDEMHYGIEKKKLEIQEFARRDLLDREERSNIREDAKGQRFMDIGGAVLDKVIGDNLSTFVGDMFSIKDKGGGKGKGKKAPTSAQQDYDLSVLDEL